MKALLAMFFSLVLIASQAAFIDGGAGVAIQHANTPKCCSHGNSCKGQSCCKTKNDSQRSAPAVPSRGVSRTDLQRAAAVVVQLMSSTATEPVALASSFSAHPSPTAPLYQRNCSYLI